MLTNKSLKILELFRTKQNIQSVADKSYLTYDLIRNNYFKHFWRMGYLDRVQKGYYIISKKGKKRIKDIKISNKIDKIILKKARESKSNEEIFNLVKQKYNKELTYSSIYSKIYKLRKRFGLGDRRKISLDITEDFCPKLAELLGLIFSDGYIHKYHLCFYNTSQALLNRFQYLVSKLFKLNVAKVRKRPSGVIEIKYYSKDLVDYINKLIANKTKIPTEILKGEDSIKTAFLKGYFSGDGGVCLSIYYKNARKQFEIARCVFLACKRQKILNCLGGILKSLNFNFRIRNGALTINRFKDLVRFNNKIGFIKKCTITNHSKNWNGFEKNQLLKYIAYNLKNDTKLRKLLYTSKKEIIRHIKNKLRYTRQQKTKLL